MARPELANGEIYHIYNRGTDGRKVFLEDADYFRFIHDLFEFNNDGPIINLNRRFSKENKSAAIGNPSVNRKKRKLLVDILIFCLIPNHFHLMVRQRIENGISKFMQKLGTGYTNYFNTKFERKGVLFQGKYKVKLVATDEHFMYLPHYIHLNPLDLVGIKWREGSVENPKEAVKFLESYRWSSYQDYIGKKNFPSVTQRGFLLDVFGGIKGYNQSILEWLTRIDLDKLEEVIIE